MLVGVGILCGEALLNLVHFTVRRQTVVQIVRIVPIVVVVVVLVFRNGCSLSRNNSIRPRIVTVVVLVVLVDSSNYPWPRGMPVAIKYEQNKIYSKYKSTLGSMRGASK